MGREAKHRDKIVRATAELLRRRGYAATGINEIAELSGAPKGSLYHYFPDGKEQIAAEALRYAGDLVRTTILNLTQTNRAPADAVRAYGRLLCGWMAQSAFTDGCPIATTMLEVSPNESAIVEAGGAALASWIDAYADALNASGVPVDKARVLARNAVMLFEGALILARVERNAAAIETAAEQAASLFDAAVADAARSAISRP
jgi:TetR/AcrR family transcriptional regulator, lmrAB and yxaGH operons repressor